MKKILFGIILLLAFTCCMPQTPFCLCGCDLQHTESSEDDDSMQTAESIAINFARKNKKIKIEKQEKITERKITTISVSYHATEFNYNGILNETIKRDYSGENNPDNINII